MLQGAFAADLYRGLPPPGLLAAKTMPSMMPSPTSCPKAAPRASIARWCETRRSPRSAEGFTGYPGVKYPHLFAFSRRSASRPHAHEMADAIHAEIEKLKKEDISDDELKMIKTRSQGQPDSRPGRQPGPGHAAGHLPDALRRLARAVPLPWIASIK